MKATINSSLGIKNIGFTLIELMVTIAVLAIIVTIAAPNISTHLANSRVTSTASSLSNALKEAKAESVIRRQNVTVSYDATSTPKAIILTDSNANQIASYSINDKSVITEAITPTTVTAVSFRPNKVLDDRASVVYSVCDTNTGASRRQVSVSSVTNITNQLGGGSC